MANKRRKNETQDIVEMEKVNVKKLMTVLLVTVLIVSVILSTLFLVNSFAPANPKVYHRFFLSGISGSFDGKDTPNSYSQIEIQRDGDTDEQLYTCVDIKLSTWDARPIKEIWINISDLYEPSLNIFLGKGTAGSTKLLKDITLTANDIKNNDKDGWFRLYNNSNGLEYNVSGFYGELKIGFSANVKLREVAIVDSKKGELFSSIKVEQFTVGTKPSKGINGNDKTVTHKDKFEPIDMQNVVDEQEKFPYAKAHDTDEGEHEHEHTH
ncbi:MAG: hypothetical protein E7358_00665 [Clostridiales bacterium]|nr:hypothetical protein [Clostridiales bacterium]